jgi:hypothetical protein
MISQTTHMSCTGAELYYLGALLGGETLIGVQDPFVGWLTEEIVEALPPARTKLVERGYLSVQTDGRIVPDEQVAIIVRAMANPDASFLGNRTDSAGTVEQRAFYLYGASTIELAFQPPDMYHLALRTGADEIHSQVVAWWGLDSQPAAATEPLILPEATLLAVSQRARADGMVAAMVGLLSAGVAQATAESFATALAAPHWNAALVALQRGDMAWRLSSVAALDGSPGMWRLRAFERDDAPWVEITPSSASALSEQVGQLLSRFTLA